ncbi:hypothetical protein C8R45DRAFT_515393 [Mycena sanguinolenta]|nr:hypothetical protein C8R45DRAFT_515393 [Mycena sanguinolenta]
MKSIFAISRFARGILLINRTIGPFGFLSLILLFQPLPLWPVSSSVNLYFVYLRCTGGFKQSPVQLLSELDDVTTGQSSGFSGCTNG